jgi:hypothetical protein
MLPTHAYLTISRVYHNAVTVVMLFYRRLRLHDRSKMSDHPNYVEP